MTETMTWAPAEITPSDGPLPGLLAGRLDELLLSAGAVVFRGFGITPAALDGVLDRVLRDRLAYVHGNSPRSHVGDRVYTSTEYPAEHTISMHNELSYSARWPARLAFYCETAPGSGGATPVVSGAAWLAALPPGLRAAFAGGVRYTQNLHDGHGFGKSWQETFETAGRAEVEKYLAGMPGTTWEWKRDGGLRITQVRPATVTHPVTGTEVWFNQADQWHHAALGDETAAALARIMPEEDLPQHVTFADGSPIDPAYVLEIRDRGLAAAVDVDWRAGDLLVVDNVLVAHGRRPYSGPRRVLVAMSG
ncbi:MULTISPECIES: TauD/TfdA family dioxygenase [Streptomyces]|uniref:TauD/TfdA family dioxygenase n=1 Tax=Streptomyces TaxID=1883 RepID=UPI001673DC54|nr:MULTISPECIES: TauD/TfdA family dioxygenase [Streptomyces]MBK3524161.1 TauD/TfdA family dioxygenase [Streptomyces sp. MBT70]